MTPGAAAHTETRPPAIEANGVSFSYTRDAPLLNGISFSLSPGDILTLLGPNGSGKSTLLDCLCGILPIGAGRVSVNGADCSSFSAAELARQVGYVPQTHMPAFNFPVRDYVVMGRAPHLGLFQTPGRREYEIADATLESLGIAYLADKLYSRISGGERQQVRIARVLTQTPGVILLDEPTNHLDYGNQIKILRLVADLSERGITVVLTTHMPEHPILLDGMVGILDGRGGFSTGSVAEIVSERALRDIYRVDLRLVYIEELGRLACVTGKLKDRVIV
jgi:iron complex transport system ATP-binding protein